MASSEPSIRIVLLFGGQSAEHEISRISAAHVLRAIDRSRYQVDPIAISTTGQWLRSDSTVEALASADRIGSSSELPDRLESDGTSVDPLEALAATSTNQNVVVLPILHAPRGEDGTAQGLLEVANVAYVGCGVLGSALNMDKAMSKVVASAAGLPVAKWITLRDNEISDSIAQRVQSELGWPVFVKPANMGSSVGISRATDAASLDQAIALATQFDEYIVVEEAIAGRELEVGVIGYGNPTASVVGEIVPTHDFYDFEDKYLEGAATMVIPAAIPDEVAQQMRALALDAYTALRCDGLARVDFFYDAEGRGLVFNEINTMPGFTPYSMFPSLWAAAGLTYEALIDELIRLAIERNEHRRSHLRQR